VPRFLLEMGFLLSDSDPFDANEGRASEEIESAQPLRYTATSIGDPLEQATDGCEGVLERL
jgi:hypothetical protein